MKNRELFEQLVIPVAKSYNLDYDVDGSCTYTEYYSQEFDSNNTLVAISSPSHL